MFEVILSKVLQENIEKINEQILITSLSKLFKKISHKEITDDRLLIYQYEAQRQICSLVTILNSNLFNPKTQKTIFDFDDSDIITIYRKISASLKNNKNYEETFLGFFSINSKLFDDQTIREIWELLMENQKEFKFNSLSGMYSSILTTFLDYELVSTNNHLKYSSKSRQRRSSGTYYTPMPLARKISEETVKERILAICDTKSISIFDVNELNKLSPKNRNYVAEELMSTKILDPCCGTGNILIAITETILDFVVDIKKIKNTIQNKKKILKALTQHIYGIDTNPLSVLLVKITIADLFGIIPEKKNFACGNFLNKLSNLKIKNKSVLSWNYASVETLLNSQDLKQFQIIITNPPWERIRLMEREFFSSGEFNLAIAETSHLRSKLKDNLDEYSINNLKNLKHEFVEFTRFIKNSKEFPLSSQGELNLYSLFVEQSYNIIARDGVCGFIIPSGFMTDYTSRHLFWEIFSSGNLALSYDFENRLKIFPAIDGRIRFSLVAIRKNKAKLGTKFSFFSKNIKDLEDQSKHLFLKPKDITRVNPTSKTCPIVRTKKDLQILKKIHETFPILEKQLDLWDVKYLRMLDMSLDSKKFVKTESLSSQKVSKFKKIYEGKMISMYNHRSSSSITVEGNHRRSGAAVKSSLKELQNIEFSVNSRFCIDEGIVKKRIGDYEHKWFLAFKDITSATNERTMISTILPYSGITNKLPILLSNNSPKELACLMANLNSHVYDFSCRQKIGNITLNWFIVKQIPVIPSYVYHHSSISKNKLIDWIVERVGLLTYNANDLKEWGKELGFKHPILFNIDKRRTAKIELDALYFAMYDMNQAQISHILDSFPIVKKKEEKEFGRYLLKEKILEKYNELKGDLILTLDNPSNIFD